MGLVRGEEGHCRRRLNEDVVIDSQLGQRLRRREQEIGCVTEDRRRRQ